MTRTVTRSADITITRHYRVTCPQCGPVDNADSLVDARQVRWGHWTKHREASLPQPERTTP